MFPRALRVARIRGVEVRLDPSWLLIAVLVGWTFLARYTVAERAAWVAILMAAAAAILFFGSILAHELGHAFEARHRDLHVYGVTLFLLGGVTEMDMRVLRPRDEFTVAAIGPWTSLVLASVFGLVAAALDWYAPGLDAIATVAGLLGWINLGLAVFNLVPGAPLDGGRVLRAGLWALTGDRRRAMALAGRAGQGVALLMGAAAVWAFPRPDGAIAGVWFLAIGLFLFWGASAERRQARALPATPPSGADETPTASP